ncbi:MAG: ribosome biogenesis GTPase Der [Actinomycetota bacterium]|nr:ribosome biogenesis GTPase Der [Actinomycetota bacterium]
MTEARSRPVVAVVGRANVGKSTLVNRLVGRRLAIEHEAPGVTRDRQGYAVEWSGSAFTLVDTGGWEPKAKGLTAKVVAQAAEAAHTADVIVFVGDATTGITDDDMAVARSLRRAGVSVIVAVNKVDGPAMELEAARFERLGLGAPYPVSALHGRRSGDLLDLITSTLRDVNPAPREPDDESAPRIAIVGRPNVGKSSLFNKLVGDERTIVDPTPGTTRDAVDVVAKVNGTSYRFVDTAGMRKKARQSEGPEYYGLVRSLRALDEADAAIVMIDAFEGPTEQDQKIAERVSESGRAAIIALNKWDLLDEELRENVERDVADRLRFLSWAPLVRTSAKTARGVSKIMPAVDKALVSWRTRIPTAELNAWLRDALSGVPLHRTRGPGPDVKVRYATQARTAPPEVVLFTTAHISEGARRAIERRFRERFGMEGSPVRIIVRARTPRSAQQRHADKAK